MSLLNSGVVPDFANTEELEKIRKLHTVLNVDSADRYVYVGTKPVTYTNAKKDTLRLSNNSIFWYIIYKGHEYLCAHKDGSSPMFKMSAEQISRLSAKADAQDEPNISRQQKKYFKLVHDNSKQLLLSMRKTMQTVIKGRTDGSDTHLSNAFVNGRHIVGTDVDLGGKVKHGMCVRVELAMSEYKNALGLSIIMPKGMKSKELVLRTRFCKDILAEVEKLKTSLGKKYGLVFTAPQFVYHVISPMTNGPVFGWASTYFIVRSK